jgi:predicted RNA-binding Zn-ribbon protein involved in translation (DUF1610 family)
MQLTETCTSCGERLIGRGSTSFPCPECGEEPVGRCRECRDQSHVYECTACGFRGP